MKCIYLPIYNAICTRANTYLFLGHINSADKFKQSAFFTWVINYCNIGSVEFI